MDKPQTKSFARRAWDEIVATARGALYVLPFYFAFTTVALGNYSIPSESMVPTVEVGDRIVVSKWAYGYSRYSLPLRLGAAFPRGQHRLFGRLPGRGDVVVFAHPRTGATMIKRLVGLPGDRVAMRNGVLAINGAPVRLSRGDSLERVAHKGGLEFVIRREEILPEGVRHPVHQIPARAMPRDFGPFVVPDGHVFMMGDNRDNSLDSRWPGMGPVPIENLIGRAELVYFAASSCRGEPCSDRDRWLKPLHD